MWLAPSTLLWPAYGWVFEKGDVGEWLVGWLKTMVTNPAAYLPEIAGTLLGAFLLYLLIRHGTLHKFIRTGAVD